MKHRQSSGKVAAEQQGPRLHAGRLWPERGRSDAYEAWLRDAVSAASSGVSGRGHERRLAEARGPHARDTSAVRSSSSIAQERQ